MTTLMLEVERVYNFLFVRFAQAKKDGDLDRAARLYDALAVLREVWPQALKKYKNHSELDP